MIKYGVNTPQSVDGILKSKPAEKRMLLLYKELEKRFF